MPKASSQLAEFGISKASAPSLVPGNAVDVPAVKPPCAVSTSLVGGRIRAARKGINDLPDELLAAIAERLPIESVRALHLISRQLHRITAHLVSNAQFDVALRSMPLDRQRADAIITGPSHFAYSQLLPAAQRERLDDVVRAVMYAAVQDREDVFGRVGRLPTVTSTAARPEQVTLRAAHFVKTRRDMALVLGLRGALPTAGSPEGVRQLFTTLIGRVALARIGQTRDRMLKLIREGNAGLGDEALHDIETMIAARPPNGKLSESSARLINEFRLRTSDGTEMPSPGEIVNRTRLYGDVRQVAFLTYWLDCLGHPDLQQLISLSTPQRRLIVEDYAAEVVQLPDDAEAMIKRFAAGL
jgi:hypothetical protein